MTITFYGVAFQQLQLITYFLTLLEIYIVILQPRPIAEAVWASSFSLATT